VKKFVDLHNKLAETLEPSPTRYSFVPRWARPTPWLILSIAAGGSVCCQSALGRRAPRARVI